MNKKVIFAFMKQFIFPFFLLSVLYMTLIFFDVIKAYEGHLVSHISFILIILILMNSFHEWSHLFVFLIFKVKVHAIFILGFGIIFKPRFKLIYDVKLLRLFGGIVIPTTTSIQHQETYQHLKKGYQASLLVAPIMTLISPILFLLGALFLGIEASASIYITFISAYFTWVIFPTFFMQHQHMYGDFKAYHQIKSGTILFEMQLISQAMIHGHKEMDLTYLFTQFSQQWKFFDAKQKRNVLMMSLLLKGIYQEYILDRDLIEEVKQILLKKALIKTEPQFILEMLYVSHYLNDEKLWFKCMHSLIQNHHLFEINYYDAWLSNDFDKIKHLRLKNQEDLLYFNYVKNEDTMLFWLYPKRMFKPMVCEL
jgi:hypothetical protein